MLKRIFRLVIPAALAVSVCASAMPVFADNDEDIIILYTNDVHCGIDDTIGYDGLMLYKREMEAEHKNVLLVDAGDSFQGGNVGTVSDGAFITELMNDVGYDTAVIGNHEFDYGIDDFEKRTQELECGYICCNYKSLETGETFFDPYRIFEFGDEKIAFIGVDTPETFSKSTPVYFQNDKGEYICSFCEKEGELIKVVQENVDKVRAEGADYVIILGHLGETDIIEKWSAPTLAANTEGIDAIIDGHSHEVTPSLTVKNKNGEDVIITQTGTKLANIGKMTISKDGIKTELISSVPEPVGLDESTWKKADDRDGRYVDKAVNSKIKEIWGRVDDYLSQKIGHTDFQLYDSDPETGERKVRNGETNLTDLLADAMRDTFKTDVSFLNGGGIRNCIKAGDITFGAALNVYPFSNKILAAKVKGQQILDMLELGAKGYPLEVGAFLSSVSGLEYTIDTSIRSSVTEDEYGRFTGVTGDYRVKNVLIGGEPLDPEKTYTVSTIAYLLSEGGDGYIMTNHCEIYDDRSLTDVALLAEYIENVLGGTIPEEYSAPEGQSRIKFTDGTEDDSSSESEADSSSAAEPEDSSVPDDEPQSTDVPETESESSSDTDPVPGDTAVSEKSSDTSSVPDTASSAESTVSADSSASSEISAESKTSSASEGGNPKTGNAALALAVITVIAAPVIIHKRRV